MTVPQQSAELPPHDLDTEIKFEIVGCDTTAIRRWLQSVCTPDPVFPTGIVSSIYYDLPEYEFLREKINSDYLKTKVRLRWYDTGTELVARSFVEAKFRRGRRRSKVRVETPYTGRQLAGLALHEPVLREVPHLLRPLGVSLPSALHPVLLVRYTRDRFVDRGTGARISLDTNISAPSVNHELLPFPVPLPLPTNIIEVKGNLGGLPHVLRHLGGLGARKISFSKYRACYEHVRK
jgi:hypothetical protein